MQEISKSYRSFRAIRRERVAERGRLRGLASQRVQRERRANREVDADTLRSRALHDARGQIVREGVTYFGGGRVVPWCVRRSVRGRTDQFDVFAGGTLWRTGGPRKVARWLGRLAR